MKKPTLNSLRFVSAGLSLSLALVAYNAQAQNQYFEPVSNGNTYSWDGANWTAPAAANAAPYTYNWSSGDFARFYNGASDEALIKTPLPESAQRLYQSDDHMGNFFDCVRSRKAPIAEPEVGHRSACICHLGAIALRTGKKLQWDPAKETFLGEHAQEANSYAAREMRSPYNYEFV